MIILEQTIAMITQNDWTIKPKPQGRNSEGINNTTTTTTGETFLIRDK
jgi:hypothetical protein